MALAEGDSIAYLAVQRLQAPELSFRTGAIGHGPNGAGLAERLCRHIDTWGADRTAKPSIAIYPHSRESVKMSVQAELLVSGLT